ncbi:MAG: prolipoprotein diacylglyceryl transferase [Clostridiales bacterium]|nr:prolipoprotein diacylglyceryl transferase [Clostridiales bacterium]
MYRRTEPMYPVIHIAGQSIQTYYLMAILAGIVGYALSMIKLKPLLSSWERRLLPLGLIVFAIVGARLLNAVLNPNEYKKGFHIWTLSYSKLSLMGGLVLGVIGIFLFCLLRKKDPRRIADAFVIPCACGIVLLKIGCFLNGCCFGKHTTRPWGIVFPANEKAHAVIDPLGFIYQGNHAVHPTQLYEILGVLLALCLALILKKKLKDGGTAAVFAGAFSIARWIVMPFRSFSYPKYILNIVYPLFYAVIILVCFGYGIYCFRKVEKTSQKLDQR